jgi:hypothetical protein
MRSSDHRSNARALALRRWSTGRSREHLRGAENDGVPLEQQDAETRCWHEARSDAAPGLDVLWIAVDGMQLRSDPGGDA